MLEDLRTIVQRVSAAVDLSEVVGVIVSRVRRSLNVSVCSIYLFDVQQDQFLLMATRGLKTAAVGQASLKFSEGLVGLVASKKELINVERADVHPSYKYLDGTGEEKFSSFLAVPIIHHRRVLGVLVVQKKAQRRFDEGEEAFLITLSAQLSGTIAHAESTGDLDLLIRPEKKKSGEIDVQGLVGAPGIAFGEVVVVSHVADLFAVDSVRPGTIKEELETFRKAVEQTRQDIWNMAHGLSSMVSEQERLLFTAYVQMLDDQSLGKDVLSKIQAGASAQNAWSEVIVSYVRRFEKMEDTYMQERAADLRDLGRRALGHMQESLEKDIEYPDKCILVGEELSATTLGMMPANKVVGLVSVKGSVNSHLAILARAMGIPTIVGVQGLRYGRLRGKQMIIDGYQGHVYVNPSDAHIEHFQNVAREDRQLLQELEQFRDLPAETLDGNKVEMLVNTGLMADVQMSLERGAEGVGLYRSEVPFFSRNQFPTEEEQRVFYREHLKAFSPRPVVMRTLDIGGDKPLPYFNIEEENPFLGWRGIRITLDHPEIFLSQTRAMMKASAGLNNLSMLLPMISSLPELHASLKLIHRAFKELTEEEGFDLKMPKIGAMIEVPSAIFLTREIAKRVDFLSVGSNDLTQYMLAVDRNNAQVADLYRSMHPAVLYAMNHVAKTAHAVGKKVCICGEIAGDPIGALLLVAMGYDALSMSASNLLRVKALIRNTNLADIKSIIRDILRLPDADSVEEALRERLKNPEQQRFLKIAPGLA